MDDELREQISDILLGRAITDPEMIERYNIKSMSHAQSIRAMYELFQAALAKERSEIVAGLPGQWKDPSSRLMYPQGWNEAIDQVREGIEARGKQ